jgi:hypothetical protein
MLAGGTLGWRLGGCQLASVPLPRHRSPALFGDVSPQLAQEEYLALAGIWRAEFELEDGEMAVTLCLAPPSPHPLDRSFPSEGKVHTVEENLPSEDFYPSMLFGSALCALQHGVACGSAHWSANRLVRAGSPGDDALCVSLRLGTMFLEGRGERRGLRCRTFVGRVFDEGSYPYGHSLGRFTLRLSLPIKMDALDLERRYQHRVASRGPPPLVYTAPSFVGCWRLVLAIEEEGPHATRWFVFPVELRADGSWQSKGTEETLAGRWGMYARGGWDGGWSTTESVGSNVWLRVQREQCSESSRGIAGLPIPCGFTLSGRPIIETEVQQLGAELTALAFDGVGDSASGGSSSAAATSVAAQPADGIVDRIDGRLWEGPVERAYFGRFSLMREAALTEVGKLQDRCDEGSDAACDALSQEEEAKRAWLAKQAETDLLQGQCDHGGDAACDALSREEEAKRAWLARLRVPLWGPGARRKDEAHERRRRGEP